ncbi:hypothetical protein [Candidatus Nitrotoga sp. M5]|uniref:hypothetical protein n=1 Tax=Candidatus Nitrotoga sp. M5 TaxID=2890409 RepID=UPI001EF56A1F|nr:hypothetical protein [Candidatus Nitrotoga sp. M5]CAH1387017.1 hypothetical protein NTGM5_480013 [Candidatus Nitrotoga sp. M5]
MSDDKKQDLLNAVTASIPFKEVTEISFFALSGSAEHKGEHISLGIDLGCGLNIKYKGKHYRASPADIIGGVIEAVDKADE